MTQFAIAAMTVGMAATGWMIWKLRRRNVHRWLPAYARGAWAGHAAARAHGDAPTHVIFCIADHFEPIFQQACLQDQRRRVEHWVTGLPAMTAGIRDAEGNPPKHTFFYPAEQYSAEHLERLGPLVEAGLAEVEVHLHHEKDTPEGFRRKLVEFTRRLQGRGYLGKSPDGIARYGFVHGDWALDNSLPNQRKCGVNAELRILRETGCYADFTLPSAPSAAQVRRINSIYYATDDPLRPRSHEDGIDVCAGGRECGDLMIIQGPLSITWPGGRFAILPRLENGNLGGGAPAISRRRVTAWVKTHVCVRGRPDWIFVKVHTHGCAEANWPVLFGPQLRTLHEELARFNDGARYQLHYVSAREMYNMVKAAERGLTGNPAQYRDLIVAPPERTRSRHVRARKLLAGARP